MCNSHISRTVAGKYSTEGLYVCAGELDVIKIEKTLIHGVSIWGLEMCFAGLSLPKPRLHMNTSPCKWPDGL